MAFRNAPFVQDEWYHCYNKSIEKRVAFTDAQDYRRFLELLYLANDETPLRRDDLGVHKFEEIFLTLRSKSIVAIGAFCLMPNHYHLVLKEISAGGITKFMRKIGTAYALYFNTRHERMGNLFLRPFRSRHVSNDRYFQHLIHYVHSNPAALYESEWKTGHIVDPQFLEDRLKQYPYSSLNAHSEARTPMRAILDREIFSIVHPTSVQDMLKGALKYGIDSAIP